MRERKDRIEKAKERKKEAKRKKERDRQLHSGNLCSKQKAKYIKLIIINGK